METILRGSVGLLTARSGGHLVSLQCYVSPDDIFEEGTGAQLNFTDVNSEKIVLSIRSTSIVKLNIHLNNNLVFIYFKVIDHYLLFLHSAVPRTLGVSVSVTVEGTTSVYKLPIAPLITGSHPVDNKGSDN